MPTITFTPDPPQAGKPCLCCVSGAVMPLDVVITYADGTSETHHVDKFCFTFTPPLGSRGLGMTAHDQSDQAKDESRIIL
jgi:hypothetical protein